MPEALQKLASEWFATLRTSICDTFEAIETEYAHDKPHLTPGRFTFTPWDHTQGGGGVIGLMKGNVFEKVGVNISTVHGHFTEAFKKEIPGTEDNPAFWASGISVVSHPTSPLVPTAHMNTRHIVTAQKKWFGGGGDLTPYFPFEEDTRDFHHAYQTACDTHDPTYYATYKKWCDEYFFLPHRNEPRGVGGIFYDYLNSGDLGKDFLFTQDVGKAFRDVYSTLVRRRMHVPWTPEQRAHQLIRRGRYVEFNLLYDRGTLFGLKTGGNVEGILMSLPPEVKWI
jgi:coproporphyrinogen III oxidase